MPESALYTSHAFHRSSATFLANAGADINVLKRHGGWKSTSVAERYVEDSIDMKNKIARMIQGTSSSEVNLKNTNVNVSSSSSSAQQSFGGIKFENLQNCTFHMHFKDSDSV